MGAKPLPRRERRVPQANEEQGHEQQNNHGDEGQHHDFLFVEVWIIRIRELRHGDSRLPKSSKDFGNLKRI